MSLFITFEGIEGSGKTTQIKLLNEILKLRGYQTVLTREPGGTPIGDDIRSILLDSKNKGLTPLCELFLIAASRAQHVEQVIAPALQAKKIVLCDRFSDATWAYQGNGRGFSHELIDGINQTAINGVSPHLTFLLDCEPVTGLKRARDRMARLTQGPIEDRFENEPMDFHQRVREGYLQLAQREPNRIHKIEAGLDVEMVHQKITSAVLSALTT